MHKCKFLFVLNCVIRDIFIFHNLKIATNESPAPLNTTNYHQNTHQNLHNTRKTIQQTKNTQIFFIGIIGISKNIGVQEKNKEVQKVEGDFSVSLKLLKKPSY